MTTSSDRHLHALPADPDVPSEANFSAAVRALAGAHKLSAQALALALGVSDATMHRRLAGKGKVGWTMLEMNSVAALFQHSVDDLLRGRVSLHVTRNYGGPGQVRLDDLRARVRGEAGTLADGADEAAGARSSTDRASDYGSENVKTTPRQIPLRAAA